MATLNGNLGGFKERKMNCGAGKLISAEYLLLIHGDDCAFYVPSFLPMHQLRYSSLTTLTIYVNMISVSLGLKQMSYT